MVTLRKTSRAKPKLWRAASTLSAHGHIRSRLMYQSLVRPAELGTNRCHTESSSFPRVLVIHLLAAFSCGFRPCARDARGDASPTRPQVRPGAISFAFRLHSTRDRKTKRLCASITPACTAPPHHTNAETFSELQDCHLVTIRARSTSLRSSSESCTMSSGSRIGFHQAPRHGCRPRGAKKKEDLRLLHVTEGLVNVLAQHGLPELLVHRLLHLQILLSLPAAGGERGRGRAENIQGQASL